MYQIGRLRHPADDDPRYEKLDNALRSARLLAADMDDVIGVWDEDGERLKYIIYERDIFELNASAVEDAQPGKAESA